jgi:V/A-type H+-transporting ATPase subunit C
METRLLDRQWIERLLSESAAGALKALGDSDYQEALADVGRPEEIEPGLERALAETLALVASIAPEPALIDLFRMRWDVRNLKALLKASFLKLEGVPIGTVAGLGTVELAVIEKAVGERDYAPLPGFLAEAARRAEDGYRDRGELGIVDRVLDAAMWDRSLGVARSRGSAFLEEYFSTEIDLANIRTFVRIKEAGKDRSDLDHALLGGGTLDGSFFADLLGESLDSFARALEYGRYGDLTPVFREWSPERSHLLDLACDNFLIKLVDRAKTIAYGVEPLVAFILYRQIEIKLVRTAIVAKLDAVERGDVESRLRALHV